MLRVGDKVIIGDTLAGKYNYEKLVGRRGTIEHIGHSVFVVKVDYRGLWYIQRVDCIPIPDNNEACWLMFLKGDDAL